MTPEQKLERRMVERDIATAKKRLARLDEKIGKLMSERVTVEEEIADLYGKVS